MAYKPIMSGGVIVEVDKAEYEELVRKAERITVVERLLLESKYATVRDILAVLGIENKEKEGET